VNGFDITETLIDGGLIANDPAYFAYTTERYMRGCKNIRVVSIGTGNTVSE